jgi:predicted nucleotidyltransferase
MYTFQAAYPSPQHEQAAHTITEYFSGQPGVEAVLLTCSCARGKASRDSCLDIAILVPPDEPVVRQGERQQAWDDFYHTEPVFEALRQVGKYSQVDLDFVDGRFAPGEHGWTSGPDEFELQIGNLLAYSVALWERGSTFEQLKAQWLPYYDEMLRRDRLAMVRRYCLNNLHHIPLYVERGLYFQSFRRLVNAFGEFLQALFISRKTYPIAYDKWIKEQIVEILDMPALYPQLPRLFEIQHFESREIAQKASDLESLVEKHVVG